MAIVPNFKGPALIKSGHMKIVRFFNVLKKLGIHHKADFITANNYFHKLSVGKYQTYCIEHEGEYKIQRFNRIDE